MDPRVAALGLMGVEGLFARIENKVRMDRTAQPPAHDLIGIADVIDRRDLAARKSLMVLMGQHLQFELRTVRASLGA